MLCILALALVSFASSAATVSTDNLESKLRVLSNRVGEPVLVGAVGAGAEKAASRCDGQHQIVRVPSVGDPEAEMARALSRAGLRCGVRLEELSGRSWKLETYGECRSASQIASEAGGQPVDDLDSVDFDEIPATPAPSVAGASQQAEPVVNLDRGDPWRVARAYGKAPDPMVAALDSLLLGFGTGHFYAGNHEEGFAHLGTQVGLLGVIGLSALVMSEARNTGTQRFGSIMVGVGSSALVGARVVDFYRAPISARDETYRLLKGR